MKLLGLIGFPLGHSRSPELFQQFFSRDGVQGWDYQLFPMEALGGLRAWIRQHPELRGLNVTIPHKEAVIPQLDALDDTARQTGAVNCIKISRNPELHLKGYNTDVPGFAQMLDAHLQGRKPKALVLGTGGASKAVQYVLRKRGIPFKTVSRYRGKADLVYEEVDANMVQQHHLIIHTSPLGMLGVYEGMAPDLPYGHLSAEHICLDLVYNPERTPFMELSALQDARVENGLGMLRAQAEAAWEIFRG
jgi:shikimate dehydrogenase